jgi:hypothetical protein
MPNVPKADTAARTSLFETVLRRRSTFARREVIAAAYLRAAQAYMLISMPTGTSTILGAFQAILALLANGANFALPDKLLRKEKFAS